MRQALADYLIAQAVHPGGVVALPRCGDGPLAVALATRTNAPIVYAADAPEQYAAARDAAAQAGLLGRSVFVQQAAPSKLPLAACYADLAVLVDLVDADLQPPLLAEIQRILVPLNGRAVVGRAKSSAGTGKLTRAALEAWAKASGTATDVQIVDDAQGLWAVFGRPALAAPTTGPTGSMVRTTTRSRPTRPSRVCRRSVGWPNPIICRSRWVAA